MGVTPNTDGKLVDIWNVCIRVLCNPTWLSSARVFCVLQVIFLDKITHKPNPHYTQIVPEYINHIGINSCFQGTCYSITDYMLDINVHMSSKQLDLQI